MGEHDAAERVARERLARSIARDEVAYASDLALLEQHLRQIRRALLEGGQPRSEDITTAELALDALRDDLADVETLFSWTGEGVRDSKHCRAGPSE